MNLTELGRVEIDQQIDERLFGKRLRLLPNYSTDIAAPWAVVAEMRVRGYWVKITGPWTPEDSNYSVGFTSHGTVHCGSSWVQAEAPSLPLAICLAALFTLDVEEAVERKMKEEATTDGNKS